MYLEMKKAVARTTALCPTPWYWLRVTMNKVLHLSGQVSRETTGPEVSPMGTLLSVW